MTGPKYPFLKKLLILPPILIGFAILFFIVSNRKAPERTLEGEKARSVRTIQIPKVDFVPRVLGYGTAQPEKTWEAVAEVSGKIVEINPDLRSGKILRKGTQILRIDPTDYELIVAQEEANLADASSELMNLAVQEENARQLLKIEEDSLVVSRRQLGREESLLSRGAIPETQYELTEKTVLSQQNQVQSFKNILNLVPTQREKIQAQIAVIQARLQKAGRDLEHSRIITPFDCRVADNRVEMGEAVVLGQVLAQADGIDVSEVPAQVPIDKMRTIASIPGRAVEPIGAELFGVMDRIPLKVIVRLRSGDFNSEWEGRFARISDAIDPQTRTVGVVAAVDDPYLTATPGIRPPLVKGMYCEVEIRGASTSGALVVPRSAIHEKGLYLVDAENRLRWKEVTLQTYQSDFCVVGNGVEEGDTLVVTDLVPAIEGMLLDPVEDPESLERLVAQATGKSEVR